MASALGLQLQATFASGARQRPSRVGLSPAPARNAPQLKQARVLIRKTPRLSRGRVRSSWGSSGPPEGPSVERKAITARRKAAGLQALAVAAACAVGASLCLSRRAAAMPDTKAAVTTAAPIAGEGREVKTKVLLHEIMFGRKEPGTECEDPCKKLFDHAFGLLPLDNRLQLLEQIVSKGIITEANVGPHEAYEMQIAIVQIYMAMHEYHKAKKVWESMHAIENDHRIPLFKAVLDMMLALEKLLTGATTEDQEVKGLIKSAKDSWKKHEELKDFGEKPPSVE